MSLNPRIEHWQGRTVWVVGASSGIGQALAHQLHVAGATVMVSARSEPALQEFVLQHPGSHALPLDVTDREAMGYAMHEVLRMIEQVRPGACWTWWCSVRRTTAPSEPPALTWPMR